MRKALFLVLAMLAVVITASAATATSSSQGANATVSITGNGFTPANVTVRPGDTVTWKNNDTKAHSVVSDTGTFASQSLNPGQTYSFTFSIESSYAYHDGMKASTTGTVHVLTSKVSIGLTRMRTVYRNPVRIFGSIPNSATGEAVTLHITQYGKPEVTKTVVTEAGEYELMYRPTIGTEVFATWNGTTSEASPRIGVRPLVIFRTLNARQNQFLVQVKAARSYANKTVRIQRQNARGIWVTTTKLKLNRFGKVRFTGTFGPGVTKAQATVSRAPGYQPGFSTVKIVRR